MKKTLPFRLVSVISLGAALLSSSCKSTTGTKIEMTQESLAKIESLGVSVKQSKGFSVSLAREKMTNTGAAMGGFIGGAIEASMRSSHDDGIQKELMPGLADFNPRLSISTQVCEKLRQTNLFCFVKEVPDDGVQDKGEFDAVLLIDVKKWGLIFCPGESSSESLQVSFDLEIKMTSKDLNKNIWERIELYRHHSSHPLSAFKNEDHLLRELMEKAISDLVARIVNEIIYSQRYSGPEPGVSSTLKHSFSRYNS